MTPRVLALDVGERRIGVAVSDPLGLTAQGVETIQSNGWNHDIERISQLLEQYETDRLLVGLPRTLSGETGPQAQTAEVCTECILFVHVSRLLKMSFRNRIRCFRHLVVSGVNL